MLFAFLQEVLPNQLLYLITHLHSDCHIVILFFRNLPPEAL